METLVTKSNCSMGFASSSSFGGGSGRKDQVIFQRDNNVLGERICFVLTMSASVGARKGLVRVHNLTKEVHMGDMKTRQCNFIFTHMLVIAFTLPTYAFKYSWTSSCYVFCRFPQLMVVPPQ